MTLKEATDQLLNVCREKDMTTIHRLKEKLQKATDKIESLTVKKTPDSVMIKILQTKVDKLKLANAKLMSENKAIKKRKGIING